MIQSTFHCLKHVRNQLLATERLKVFSTSRINTQGQGAGMHL